MPEHIHHHYAPSVTHTSSLQLHPHTHHIVAPGFVDRSHRSELHCWWTTSGKIGLAPSTPPPALVGGMGVDRQQQQTNRNRPECYQCSTKSFQRYPEQIIITLQKRWMEPI